MTSLDNVIAIMQAAAREEAGHLSQQSHIANCNDSTSRSLSEEDIVVSDVATDSILFKIKANCSVTILGNGDTILKMVPLSYTLQ